MSGIKGKTVLITGGGTGLGADMAARFAAEGARVWVSGRTAATLEQVASQHGDIHMVEADVTDKTSVAAMFDFIDTPISLSPMPARRRADHWSARNSPSGSPCCR